MLQQESDMGRSVEIRDQLDVIAQSVSRQLLILLRTQRLRFDHRGRAFELKMAFQFQDESVDPERGGRADRPLEVIEPVQMMGVVPVDVAAMEIGPVRDSDFGQAEASRQLRESRRSVEK